jgi:hypothetical protein
LFDKKMKKYVSTVIVVICVAGAIGFWVHGYLSDPMRRGRVALGRDVVQWYFDTLSIRQSGHDTLRPEAERNRIESRRKDVWGIPSETSLFEEKTEFHDVSHDELIFKYTATFTYPGRQEFVIVTETYLADAEHYSPLPIKREIIDTKAKPRMRKVFLWDGSFNEYLLDRFGCKIVEQDESTVR